MKKIDLQNMDQSLRHDVSGIGLFCSGQTTETFPGYDVTFTGRVTLRIAQGGLRNKFSGLAKCNFKTAWQQLCKTISVPLDSTGLLFLDYAEGKLKGAVFSPNIKN